MQDRRQRGQSPSITKTVLIVDRDLGFIVWLGLALHESGYRTLPATGVHDATSLLTEIQITPDLLIIDPALEGALKFIEHLCRSIAYLKVIAVTVNAEQSFEGVDATVPKPSALNDRYKVEWLLRIENLVGPGSKSVF